jgi:hypothetical protein
MISAFEEREEEGIRAVAERYRKLGYEVIVEPRPSLLPAGLRRFHPALVARNGNENVLIEVKSKASLDRSPELPAVAQAVERLLGWRFELVIVNPELSSSVPVTGAPLSRVEIAKRLNEARKLNSLGHLQAAVLLAWSAAEAALRRAAAKGSFNPMGYGPAAILKELYSLGKLSADVYETLNGALEVRNALAHGFRDKVSRPSVEQICDAIERLLATNPR